MQQAPYQLSQRHAHSQEVLQCVFDVSECDYFTARLEKWNESED